MTKIVLFGGTSEGRTLSEQLGKKRIDTLICVATEYGEALLPSFASLRIHTGRLDRTAMQKLLEAEKPSLVIDATHPYAIEASDNICSVCQLGNIKHIRLLREKLDSSGCLTFPGLDELISWLNEHNSTVFSTLGAKEAAALTAVANYKERVWLRILPDAAVLSRCCAAGFLPQHLICMQGPFSKELNLAMFREARADILLTKESGTAGGYREKLEAARECGMTVAVLSRADEQSGLTLAALLKLIEEEAL